MTTAPTAPVTTDPSPVAQAGAMLSHVAGHVAVRTVELGLRHGTLAELAEHPDGLSADDLAAALGADPLYTTVWTRAAHAAGILDRADDGRFRLAPHLDTLLLDEDAPTYVGGVFTVMTAPEMFDWFSERLASGERVWWDDASHEFIRAVSGTGRPFYTRLIPGGLARVPGLTDTLHAGADVLDTACGAGVGLVRMAQTFPATTVTGADGDAYSLELAAERIAAAGLDDRVALVHTPLEQLDAEDAFDLVVNNISMHECRDVDAVTGNVHRALRPGGWFVISDLPFPADADGLRTTPGRVMSGIQFWEALIDDQLVPAHTYRELLDRHGFADVRTVELTPLHAVTFGRRA